MGKYTEVSPGVFEEEGFAPNEFRLSDEEYPRAVGTLVYHCCDVIPWIVDPRAGHVNVCLAKRCIDPARDEWWVYGGKMKFGEPEIETARRHFKEDTSLEIEPKRLTMLFGGVSQRYLWAKGVGGYAMDVKADTFAFEISLEEIEIARANLRESEYYKDQGICWFDRQGLIEFAHPAMLRIYNEICNN